MIRPALLVAVAYTTALAIWTIGRLALGEVAQSTGLIAAGALLITQCIMSTIITPWLACDAKPKVLTGLVPLVTIPWPLLLLLIKISGISTITMMASQIWVGGLIILSYFSARGLLRILREGQLRTIALTVLQLAPATALWAGRKAWIPWFTG
jgi:uncharacterized membrane protein YqgA involved in biofilm formation